ncbi:hypothetical protein ACFSO7_01300 [Bacillus sp. CGMCC 1.16607]|uniref:hypothetical protein n=1 Tax=Bacillus sp. CGMCC 1.16607 TaxID=3351842 RepID=UPI00362A88E8
MLNLEELHSCLGSAICKNIIAQYEIKLSMAPEDPDLFETKQSMKHIDVFTARLLREYPDIREKYLGGTNEKIQKQHD